MLINDGQELSGNKIDFDNIVIDEKDNYPSLDILIENEKTLDDFRLKTNWTIHNSNTIF